MSSEQLTVSSEQLTVSSENRVLAPFNVVCIFADDFDFKAEILAEQQSCKMWNI